MCHPSASNAIEPDHVPAAISKTMIIVVNQNTIFTLDLFWALSTPKL
jgi:hypothetical protein